MEKEIYMRPTAEPIEIETEGSLLTGSDLTLAVDPIPDNGGISFDLD